MILEIFFFQFYLAYNVHVEALSCMKRGWYFIGDFFLHRALDSWMIRADLMLHLPELVMELSSWVILKFWANNHYGMAYWRTTRYCRLYLLYLILSYWLGWLNQHINQDLPISHFMRCGMSIITRTAHTVVLDNPKLLRSNTC